MVDVLSSLPAASSPAVRTRVSTRCMVGLYSYSTETVTEIVTEAFKGHKSCSNNQGLALGTCLVFTVTARRQLQKWLQKHVKATSPAVTSRVSTRYMSFCLYSYSTDTVTEIVTQACKGHITTTVIYTELTYFLVHSIAFLF